MHCDAATETRDRVSTTWRASPSLTRVCRSPAKDGAENLLCSPLLTTSCSSSMAFARTFQSLSVSAMHSEMRSISSESCRALSILLALSFASLLVV